LPTLDFNAHVAQGLQAAEALGNIRYLENGVAHLLSPLTCSRTCRARARATGLWAAAASRPPWPVRSATGAGPRGQGGHRSFPPTVRQRVAVPRAGRPAPAHPG